MMARLACAIGVLLVTAVTGAASTAHALEWPTFTTPKQDPNWSIGVRFGPYRPQVAGSNTPARLWFDEYFQQGLKGQLLDKGPVLKALEFEYYFTHIFGRLGAGLSVGHWNIDADALRCYTIDGTDADGNDVHTYVDCGTHPELVETGQTEPGETRTSFTVIPIRLSGVFRADQLMQEFDIPLMPYAKAGIDMGIYWLSSGGKTTTFTDSAGIERAAEGLTWGWHFTFGLALNLDWLDPNKQGTDDSIIGFVGTHLFIEGTYWGGDGFGAGEGKFDLSDFSGFVGLTLDFE